MGNAQEVSNTPRTDRAIKSPIHPRKAKARFSHYQILGEGQRRLLGRSSNVSRFEGKTHQELYDAMDQICKAGFLNIATKAENTPLSNGLSVLVYVQELTELRGDRFFGVASQELLDETKKGVVGGRFRRASQWLHPPPPGFRRVGSFKTRDRHGNLELSFFRMGDDWIVELDIDEAAGFGHVLQVLRNLLTGRPTHPFVIYQILINRQNLNPGYSLELS
ncbi:MAG: hypothetical protein ACRD88_05520 [Terriglobia bacterium]